MRNQFLLLPLTFLLLSTFVIAQSEVGDGGPATEATLEFPSGIAIDQNGHVYVAERRGNRIRKIDAQTGLISSIAGTGSAGFSGDGSLATTAKIAHPELIAIDSQGDLFITDRSNSRIRKIDMETGLISTVAGTGKEGYSGDGSLATAAQISFPFGISVDRNDHVYFADTENHVIRKIDHETGKISTIIGNGMGQYNGDDLTTINTSLNRPHSFVITESGRMIIGDSENQRIRVVDLPSNSIITSYGIGQEGFTEDGNLASQAKFGYFGGFVYDKDKIFFPDVINKRIRVIDLNSGILTSVKGTDGRPLEISAYGIALDKEKNLVVAAVRRNQVLQISLNTGKVVIMAGKPFK